VLGQPVATINYFAYLGTGPENITLILFTTESCSVFPYEQFNREPACIVKMMKRRFFMLTVPSPKSRIKADVAG